MTKLIELDNLTKEYNGQVVLKGIHLDINEKEFVTLLGPSGCGKTTTLRIMGGFEEANGGRVLFDGQDISSLPPYKRELNTVFQKYALFPHMNVFDNIDVGDVFSIERDFFGKYVRNSDFNAYLYDC